MVNTLSLELSIVADADNKVMIQAKVPLQSLDAMLKAHGENAVKDNLHQIFSRMMADLKKSA
jgi:hypothetical protein